MRFIAKDKVAQPVNASITITLGEEQAESGQLCCFTAHTDILIPNRRQMMMSKGSLMRRNVSVS